MKYRLLAIVASLATVALVQPLRPFVVSGTSMTPTFASGQLLLGNVRSKDLTRGDVVVFHHGDEMMVKRVAYLPGDSIDRYWFVGEWKIPSSKLMLKSMIRQKLPRQRCTVPAGHLYVLGDNPYGSIDSRSYGPIPSSDIVAVVKGVAPSTESNLDGAHQGSALMAQL